MADMAAFAAGSTRSRMTSGRHKTAIVTLIERPRLDEAEATCMHRLISVGNVAVVPKTTIAPSITDPSARSGFRWPQRVVLQN
jgi:hypothetical protein